jgi:hypothetical protein
MMGWYGGVEDATEQREGRGFCCRSSHFTVFVLARRALASPRGASGGIKTVIIVKG